MGMVDDLVASSTVATENDYKGLIDVLLLCTRCRQPVKARINTPNWLRVEWIGPEGECLRCYQQAKESSDD